MVTCKYSDCAAKMHYFEMKEHLETECQAVEVPCKYIQLGCIWKGKRKKESDHEHIGINNDALLAKFKELCEEMSNLKTALRLCKDEMENFHDIIIKSNIFGAFELQSIWQEFNLEASLAAQQVHRFCGDHKKGIQLMMSFRVHVAETSDEEVQIGILCKITVQGVGLQSRRSIKAVIRFAQAPHNGNIWSDQEDEIISDDFEVQYESEWFPFVSIDGIDIDDANKTVTEQDAGSVKIFAQV